MEDDPSKSKERIVLPRRAITERMRILGELQTPSSQERNAALDALNGLAMLELGPRK